MPTLSEAESKRVLAAHGVAFPPEREVLDRARAAAQVAGFVVGTAPPDLTT